VTDRPRALIILLAVFLLGCIAGAAGFHFWPTKLPSPVVPEMRNASPGHGQGRQRMPELFQLSPEQEARFREIMAESRRKLAELQNEQRPKIEAIRAETDRKLHDILNEEQRKKFDSYLKEMQNRRGREPRGRGPEPLPR